MRRIIPLLHVVFLGMTGLLIAVFTFFGLHTVAWLFAGGVTCICTTPRHSARRK